MSKQQREFLDDLRARSVEAAADMMTGVQRLKALHDDVAGDDAELDRVRLSDYLYRLAKLELEHVANILSLGNTQAEMLFEHVRRLARRSWGDGGPRKVLELQVDPDSGAGSAQLEIHNPFDRDADPRFELSAFRRHDGTPGPAVEVALSCDVVGPHGAAMLQLDVRLGDAAVDAVLFAELAVFLSTDVEREVARRVVKLKLAAPEPPR